MSVQYFGYSRMQNIYETFPFEEVQKSKEILLLSGGRSKTSSASKGKWSR